MARGATGATFDLCRQCGLKRHDPLGAHRGAYCHWCWSETQRVQRKRKMKSAAYTQYTDKDRAEIKERSIKRRNEDIAARPVGWEEAAEALKEEALKQEALKQEEVKRSASTWAAEIKRKCSRRLS